MDCGWHTIAEGQNSAILSCYLHHTHHGDWSWRMANFLPEHSAMAAT